MSSLIDFVAKRRLRARRVADVKVFVSSDGSEIKKCRLRDISIDGAFIKTENFTATEGTKLNLVLRIRRNNRSNLTMACPVAAEVKRVTRHGAALVFGHVDRPVYNMLLDVVDTD